MVIKGAAFEALLYAPEQERYAGDVDLLVGPHDFHRAVDVLQSAGFVPMWAGAAASETAPHAAELVRGAAIVDLHRHLPLLDAAPEVVWEALWRRRRDLVAPLGSVPSLDLAGCAVVAAVHLMWSVDQPTQAATDLARALERSPDVGLAKALAEEVGGLPVFAAALRRIGRMDLVEMLRISDARSTKVILAERGAPPLALGLERLAATVGFGNRVRLIAREVVPSPDGMRYWRPWAGRSAGHLLLGYLWRPLYLAKQSPMALLTWSRARAASRQAGR